MTIHDKPFAGKNPNDLHPYSLNQIIRVIHTAAIDRKNEDGTFEKIYVKYNNNVGKKGKIYHFDYRRERSILIIKPDDGDGFEVGAWQCEPMKTFSFDTDAEFDMLISILKDVKDRTNSRSVYDNASDLLKKMNVAE